MRIAIIADIHGNLPALEAVLADIKRRAVDRTINLGDCVSGPLSRALISTAGLAVALFAIYRLHLTLWFSVPLVLISFALYVVHFWIFAFEPADRGVINRIRDRFTSLIAKSKPAAVMPLTGPDAD